MRRYLIAAVCGIALLGGQALAAQSALVAADSRANEATDGSGGGGTTQNLVPLYVVGGGLALALLIAGIASSNNDNNNNIGTPASP